VRRRTPIALRQRDENPARGGFTCETKFCKCYTINPFSAKNRRRIEPFMTVGLNRSELTVSNAVMMPTARLAMHHDVTMALAAPKTAPKNI